MREIPLTSKALLDVLVQMGLSQDFPALAEKFRILNLIIKSLQAKEIADKKYLQKEKRRLIDEIQGIIVGWLTQQQYSLEYVCKALGWEVLTIDEFTTRIIAELLYVLQK